MNAQNSEQSAHENLLLITQRIGESWRCIFASFLDSGKPEVIETLHAADTIALESLLQSKKPSSKYVILPGSATVCKTTTLPDVDENQLLEALRLQAESKFLGGTPDHRRAMAALDNSVGETNRVGLIVAWPETSTIDLPTCLKDALFIPDIGSIAALLDGYRPNDPILYADPSDGTITLAMTHANGAALRATREDASSRTSFVEGIIRITRETAVMHNHSPSFTDALIISLQNSIEFFPLDSPILLLPESVMEEASKRIHGVPTGDKEWWSTWGITAGALLAMTGSLQTLTTMRLQAPELNPTATEKIMHRCNEKSVAVKLVTVAVLLLILGPTLLSGIQLGLLNLMNPELQAQHDQVVTSRKEQIVYKELSGSTWPMTKITADVINNIPIGITIDSVRINKGEPISVRGRAIATDGKTAAELIAQMQEKLQATGVFKDIQFSYDSATTFGAKRDFDLWATVANPLKRPRYSTKDDFGYWTYAMRQAGLQPDEETDYVEVNTPANDGSIDSPLRSANPDTIGNAPETPSFLDDEEEDVGDSRRTRPPSGGSGLSSHTEDRIPGGGGGARVPDPISPEQIAIMSEDEARVALTDVTAGLQRIPSSDKETKKRLQKEMRLLFARLKEVSD
jgi:hypothetical protein